jgi:multiple sugar transport system ATP-binding protein
MANGGAAVTVGVRPEDVLVGEGTYTGHITLIEPTGHETLVQVDLTDRR